MESAENKIGNIKSFVDSINMDKVIDYLQRSEEWSYADAVTGSAQYKNYLYLLIKYANEKFPPSYTIQKVWEAHIISDTDEYIELKKRLIQNPDRLEYEEYFEQRKFIDKTIRDSYEQITKKLYLSEFGEELPTISNLSFWEKYRSTLLKWAKTLSYYCILAILTAAIIILIIQR